MNLARPGMYATLKNFDPRFGPLTHFDPGTLHDLSNPMLLLKLRKAPVCNAQFTQKHKIYRI